MKRQIAFVAGAALLWLSLATGAAGLATSAQAVNGWEYRWEVGADKTSQVWRRPAGSPAGVWTRVGIVPQEILELVTSRAEPSLALARTTQALFETRDAGQRWQQVQSLPDWPTAVALGQEKAGLIYLGTLTGGVYRSEDGGARWQPLPWDLDMMSGTFLEVTALAVHPTGDEIVYAAAGHWLGSTVQRFTPAGVVASLDGGGSWQVFYRAGLDDPRITGLEPHAEQLQRVRASSEDGEQWLVADDAGIFQGSSEGGTSEGSVESLPGEQTDRRLSPAGDARVQAAGLPGSNPSTVLENEGWYVLALAGLFLAGAALRGIYR